MTLKTMPGGELRDEILTCLIFEKTESFKILSDCKYFLSPQNGKQVQLAPAHSFEVRHLHLRAEYEKSKKVLKPHYELKNCATALGMFPFPKFCCDDDEMLYFSETHFFPSRNAIHIQPLTSFWFDLWLDWKPDSDYVFSPMTIVLEGFLRRPLN